MVKMKQIFKSVRIPTYSSKKPGKKYKLYKVMNVGNDKDFEFIETE